MAIDETTPTPTLAHFARVWDSAITRFAAVAAYLLTAIYLSGAIAIAGRLYRRDVPITAVIGAFPRTFLITVGLEAVFAPSLALVVLLSLFSPKLFFETRWAPWEPDEARQGLWWRLGRIASHAFLPVVLATTCSAMAIAIVGLYKRRTYYDDWAQFVWDGLAVFAVTMLAIEARNRVIDYTNRASDRSQHPRARYVIGVLATLPVFLAIFASLATAFPFPDVEYCGPDIGTQDGNLIVQSSDTLYVLQTNPHGVVQPAILQAVPLASIRSVAVDGSCPTASS